MSSQTIPDSSTPLFVVGMYRSGTTLLYALLNQHPAIALMYECDSLAVPAVQPAARRWPRWMERNEFWNHFLTRHRLTAKELGAVRDLGGLYQAFARRTGASFYGEKSPAYHRWLPKLAANFPGARLIVVLREMPEIYQSMLDAGRNGSRFFSRHGQLPRLLWSHRVMLRDIGRLQRSRVPILFVRYREAVQDAQAIGRRICEFLQIEFDEAMASLIGADLSAIYDAPHHDQVRSERINRRLANRARISNRLHLELRMFAQASGQEAFVPAEQLPALTGRLWVGYLMLLATGGALCLLDDTKRFLYEYLPASWFHRYRNLRNRKNTAEKSGAKAVEQGVE